MLRFYGYFAACYGTIWFCLMMYAIVTRSFVKTGEFGLYGFPIIALFYALLRSAAASNPEAEIEALEKRIDWLEDQLAEFTDDRVAEPLQESEIPRRRTSSQAPLIIVMVFLSLLLIGLAVWVFLG